MYIIYYVAYHRDRVIPTSFCQRTAHAVCITRHVLAVCVFIYTGEDDLEPIVTEIGDITDVQCLGLKLGIRMSALLRIKAEDSQLEGQKTMVIYHWLTRRDIVQQKQNERPTWNGLANAVAQLNPTLSDRIHHQHCQT